MGARTIIRSIQEDDLGHMNDLMGNEEVMRFVGAEGARDEERISRTASGALEMRPRAFFELDLQRLVEAPKSGVASNHEAVTVGEVSTQGREGSKKIGETMDL